MDLRYSTYGDNGERRDGCRFAVGVDLGQARDPSAVGIIRERVTAPSIRNGLKEAASALELVHLERFGIDQPYPDQVSHVQAIVARPPLSLWAETRVGLDATGVGRAVSDLAARKGLRHTPITITSGDSWSRDGNSRRVSKSLLVGQLLTSLHDKRLMIAAGIPYAETLKKELADFRAHYTDSGNAIFNAREGTHDDLVLAVALAHWMAIYEGPTLCISRGARFAT